MASSESYLQFILGQLGGLEGITSRKMRGEYLLYFRDFRGKGFGGIYDDRLLVKRTPFSAHLSSDGRETLPYPEAKPIFLSKRWTTAHF